jgi:hypothetical protein
MKQARLSEHMNIWRQITTFIRSGDLTSKVCAPLPYNTKQLSVTQRKALLFKFISVRT